MSQLQKIYISKENLNSSIDPVEVRGVVGFMNVAKKYDKSRYIYTPTDKYNLFETLYVIADYKMNSDIKDGEFFNVTMNVNKKYECVAWRNDIPSKFNYVGLMDGEIIGLRDNDEKKVAFTMKCRRNTKFLGIIELNNGFGLLFDSIQNHDSKHFEDLKRDSPLIDTLLDDMTDGGKGKTVLFHKSDRIIKTVYLDLSEGIWTNDEIDVDWKNELMRAMSQYDPIRVEVFEVKGEEVIETNLDLLEDARIVIKNQIESSLVSNDFSEMNEENDVSHQAEHEDANSEELELNIIPYQHNAEYVDSVCNDELNLVRLKNLPRALSGNAMRYAKPEALVEQHNLINEMSENFYKVQRDCYRNSRSHSIILDPQIVPGRVRLIYAIGNWDDVKDYNFKLEGSWSRVNHETIFQFVRSKFFGVSGNYCMKTNHKKLFFNTYVKNDTFIFEKGYRHHPNYGRTLATSIEEVVIVRAGRFVKNFRDFKLLDVDLIQKPNILTSLEFGMTTKEFSSSLANYCVDRDLFLKMSDNCCFGTKAWSIVGKQNILSYYGSKAQHDEIDVRHNYGGVLLKKLILDKKRTMSSVNAYKDRLNALLMIRNLSDVEFKFCCESKSHEDSSDND